MKGKSTLGSTTTEIPGCSSSLCMVLFGGTSRRSAPSGTRRGVGCGERSGCFQLLALFTLGFWTLLLRARGSGKRLPRCFGVYPRLLLEEFQLSLVSLPKPFCTWRVRLGRGPRHAPVYGCYWKNFLSLVHALFALGIWWIISVSLSLAVNVPGVWVLLMSTKIGFFGRRLSSWEQCLVPQWIHALRQ